MRSLGAHSKKAKFKAAQLKGDSSISVQPAQTPGVDLKLRPFGTGAQRPHVPRVEMINLFFNTGAYQKLRYVDYRRRPFFNSITAKTIPLSTCNSLHA